MSQKAWEVTIENLVRNGILRSHKVIRALSRVPRSLFIPNNVKKNAAMDCPLPIGSGQTVSAPHS